MKPYEQAILKWGESSQIKQCKEELAELIVALSHWERGRALKEDVIEEMVDVEIMLEQMKVIFENENYVNIKKMKVDRLEKRLNV